MPGHEDTVPFSLAHAVGTNTFGSRRVRTHIVPLSHRSQDPQDDCGGISFSMGYYIFYAASTNNHFLSPKYHCLMSAGVYV